MRCLIQYYSFFYNTTYIIKSDQKYRPPIENYNITASADGIDGSFNKQLQPSVTSYDLSFSIFTMYTVSKITVNVIACNVLGYNKGSETTISKYSIAHIHNYDFSDCLTIISFLHNILKSFLHQLPLVRVAQLPPLVRITQNSIDTCNVIQLL